MARILFVEPFCSGSHRAFLEGLVATSSHRFDTLTHPGRFWKWRMRGSAMTMAAKANRLEQRYDLILASDMLSVAEFLSLLRSPAPVVLYMHENQLSYPVPKGEAAMDVQFGFTNITSCLAAERVVFNSAFHRDSFLSALPGFIRMMPDCRPRSLPQRIAAKSQVLYPGVDLQFFEGFPRESGSGPRVILWNHRWEFDKQPEMFFAAVESLAAKGIDFRLIICGENFQAKPRIFMAARRKFASKIIHMGYVEDRSDYARLLRMSDVVISSALQENFGMSVVEAVFCGAYPLLFKGLSYPELLPREYHEEHLFEDLPELVVKLEKALTGNLSGFVNSPLPRHFARFDWSRMIGRYDDMLDEVCRNKGSK